jgi:NAD(P)-dependent dehydrogenase (short-subunit alcohol dehydrogenase family)
MRPSLNGKTILVTGAATGIGRGIALAAAASGANLVLGDIAEAALGETAAEAAAGGGEVLSRRCDVTSQADIDALVGLAAQAFGHPDIVFANAGVEGPAGLPWDLDEADFTRILDLNFLGVWRTLKATAPQMIARRRGSFVATASVAGLVGAEGLGPYVSSKHAIVGLVKAAALSAAPSNVRVNALCPGLTDTPLLDRLAGDNPGMREALMDNNPMKRLGRVQEIADAALWLGSDEASYVTGHTLAIDGGYVAR